MTTTGSEGTGLLQMSNVHVWMWHPQVPRSCPSERDVRRGNQKKDVAEKGWVSSWLMVLIDLFKSMHGEK